MPQEVYSRPDSKWYLHYVMRAQPQKFQKFKFVSTCFTCEF